MPTAAAAVSAAQVAVNAALASSPGAHPVKAPAGHPPQVAENARAY